MASDRKPSECDSSPDAAIAIPSDRLKQPMVELSFLCVRLTAVRSPLESAVLPAASSPRRREPHGAVPLFLP